MKSKKVVKFNITSEKCFKHTNCLKNIIDVDIKKNIEMYILLNLFHKNQIKFGLNCFLFVLLKYFCSIKMIWVPCTCSRSVFFSKQIYNNIISVSKLFHHFKLFNSEMSTEEILKRNGILYNIQLNVLVLQFL